MQPINAGKLRHRITIQQSATSANDAAGHPVVTWSSWKTGVPAAFGIVTGNESEVAGRTIAKTQAMFTIRYLSGLTTKMRIVHNSTTYQIDFIDEEREIDRMDVYCKVQS